MKNLRYMVVVALSFFVLSGGALSPSGIEIVSVCAGG